MTSETFEREKLCYEQNFEQARSLNAQMNRVPTISITLTGGLWFGAAATDNVDSEIRFGLLFFAGICNFALVLASLRIRDVLESYLEKIKAFHKKSFADGHPGKPKLGRFGSYSMITIYCILMIVAGLMSMIGAFFFYWPFSSYALSSFLLIFLALIVTYLLLIRRKGGAH